MNGADEVSRLLEEAGAVLVRHNKHLVYRLPNGNVFTRSKTASDHRSPMNELSDLRRALGIARQPKEDIKVEQHQQKQQRDPVPAPAEATLGTEAAGDSFSARIARMIEREEAEQERLLSDASSHEKRVQMLKALLPFAEDAATEVALLALLPPSPPVERPKPLTAPAEPPQRITERVQVTRQLVFAATQTFDGPFTVNDVMALMTGGRQIDPTERTRIRSSVAQCVMSLYERGELVKEQEHLGRRQTIWRKAQLNSNSIGKPQPLLSGS